MARSKSFNGIALSPSVSTGCSMLARHLISARDRISRDGTVRPRTILYKRWKRTRKTAISCHIPRPARPGRVPDLVPQVLRRKEDTARRRAGSASRTSVASKYWNRGSTATGNSRSHARIAGGWDAGGSPWREVEARTQTFLALACRKGLMGLRVTIIILWCPLSIATAAC